MMIDSLDHARALAALGSRIERALDYLSRTEFSGMPPGTYEIDGRNLYAVVQRYSTKLPDQGKWEVHRRYLDVQYVASGAERIGYAAGSRTEPGPYDEERDYEERNGDGDFLTLRAGELMVLWPGEVHMPGVAVDQPSNVIKAVVKVLMD